MRSLEVLEQRGLALFEDEGRAHRSSGVPGSGAFDRGAHRTAMALVGGGAHEAALEIAGLLAVRARVRCTVAVTGVADVTLDGDRVPAWTCLDLPARSVLAVASARRAYLAVAGGFRPPSVLGSRSTCLLGSLGPSPVVAGDRLAMVADPVAATVGDWSRSPHLEHVLRVVPGPHLELIAQDLSVVDGSRIGVRVRPARVVPARGSLPSLGVCPGAIQVLPSGDWMILGPDAGTMGGYPVVGVVCTADLDRVAQLVTGDRVRVVPTPASSAPPQWMPQIVRASLL